MKFLTEQMEKCAINVITCPGDADTEIVKVALENVSLHKTLVVSDDTDIAIMLLHHVKSGGKDLLLWQPHAIIER